MAEQVGEVVSRAVGTQVGGYRLLAWLGSGGMAEVFLAAPPGAKGTGSLVALKMLRRELASLREVVTQFQDEARLAARLDHPNVIRIVEVGRHEGELMIVMEYLEGCALGQVAERAKARGERLPVEVYLQVLSGALVGLHYAHEASSADGVPLNVVHRDVTPHNIFVTHEGQVKVLDFGIAKAATSISKTRSGTTKGTVRYMAPEHIRGERVDRRADVFAVGVILFEALTDSRMFEGLRPVGVLNRVARGEIPRVRSVRPDAPERLAEICDRALSADRDLRHPTCLDLRADIEAYLDALPSRPTEADLRALLARLFGDDRRERQALIDAQLRGLAAPGVSGELPRLGRQPSSGGLIDLGATTASTSIRPAVPRPGRVGTAALAVLLLLAAVALGLVTRGRGYW